MIRLNQRFPDKNFEGSVPERHCAPILPVPSSGTFGVMTPGVQSAQPRVL